MPMRSSSFFGWDGLGLVLLVVVACLLLMLFSIAVLARGFGGRSRPMSPEEDRAMYTCVHSRPACLKCINDKRNDCGNAECRACRLSNLNVKRA